MRKTLLLLLGPSGAGKSTAARALLNMLRRAALVDGDWCRAMNPYDPGVAVKNMRALIRNSLLCPGIDLVVLAYGLHGDRALRLNAVLDGLRRDGIDFEAFTVVLACSLEENIRRARADGRGEARIRRGIENTFHLYDGFGCPRIDTTDLTPEQAAAEVLALIKAR